MKIRTTTRYRRQYWRVAEKSDWGRRLDADRRQKLTRWHRRRRQG